MTRQQSRRPHDNDHDDENDENDSKIELAIETRRHGLHRLLKFRSLMRRSEYMYTGKNDNVEDIDPSKYEETEAISLKAIRQSDGRIRYLLRDLRDWPPALSPHFLSLSLVMDVLLEGRRSWTG